MIRKKYKATHSKSGRTFEGSAQTIANLLHTDRKIIYSYAQTGSRVRGVWEIEDMTEYPEKTNKYIPQSKLDDWDRVRADVKNKLRSGWTLK